MKTNHPGVLRFGLIATVFAGLAVSAVAAEFYAATGGGYFGTLDPVTGSFFAINQTNGLDGNVTAMGFGANGNLYGFGWENGGQLAAGQLFLINLSTGVPSPVGAPGFNFNGTVSGMTATPDGTLYAYTASGRIPTPLFTINPTNGAEGIVGSMGVHLAGAFASDGTGGLFITQGVVPEQLYRVNPSTGAATLIGATGSGIAAAMAFDQNTLYLVDVNGVIWTLNTTTGVATGVSAYNGQSLYGPLLSLATQFGLAEPVPVIRSIVPANGSVTLAWSAVSGRSYQVQYSTDLAGGNWTDLGPRIMANGTKATTTDPISSNSLRFYRVALLPL